VEEFAHLGRLAADARALLDAFASFGDGACGLPRELLADKVTMSSQIAYGASNAPLPQTVQTARAEGGDVALHGSAAQASDLGSFLAADATVEKPQHKHLAADMLLGVGLALSIDQLLLFLGQLNPKPGHCESLQAEANRAIFSVLFRLAGDGNVSVKPARSIAR
jgi:hypothetical protein